MNTAALLLVLVCLFVWCCLFGCMFLGHLMTVGNETNIEQKAVGATNVAQLQM